MTTPEIADTLARALAARTPQPAAAFDALGHLAETLSGASLVTLTASDPRTGEAEQLWTNRPHAYPVAGRKPTVPNRWSEAVPTRHETFVANSVEEIAEVFPDHALIRSLGCESVVNLPAVVAGDVVGTLNCLGPRGHFTPERVAAVESLRLADVAVFLLGDRRRGAAR